MDRECTKCGVTKPLSDFYKHHLSREGRMTKCMECTKDDARANRAKRLEYYREYDRQRANIPSRVKARAEYAKSERGKAAARKASAKYSARPDRRRANHFVSNAVRDGKLKKLDACECCGSQKSLQAHHPSYAEGMELVVTWLCTPCHARLHKEHRQHMREAG